MGEDEIWIQQKKLLYKSSRGKVVVAKGERKYVGENDSNNQNFFHMRFETEIVDLIIGVRGALVNLQSFYQNKRQEFYTPRWLSSAQGSHYSVFG